MMFQGIFAPPVDEDFLITQELDIKHLNGNQQSPRNSKFKLSPGNFKGLYWYSKLTAESLTAQAASVYIYFESRPVSMALFGQSQSVDSAYREKSSCSGPRSVLSTDQNKDLLWNKVSLEPPTDSYSGESRYLTLLWVSRNEEPLNELNRAEIVPRIRATLKQLVFREQRVLVQFWVARAVGKHQLLTTSDQPFGLGLPIAELCFYRKESEQTLLFVCKDDEEQDISPPARVFRQGLPEWTFDLTNYSPKHFSQQDCAIHCNLHGYLALPIFDSTTELCIGVLEILMSSKNTDYTFEVQQVHKALKIQGLTCPQIFDSTTPKVPSECRQNTWDKIYSIMKSVCDVHNLPLAQTWAVSPFTSFVSHDKNIRKSCGSFDTKCFGKACMSTSTALPFHVRDMGMWPFREACKLKHLDRFRSFVGRTMLAHSSSYCEDITQLCEEEYPLVHNARMSGLMGCFTMFLHSIEGDKDDCVLEFFLPLNSKDSRLVLNLVQTLKQMIVMASGFELGELSPIKITGSPRDETFLSLSIEPQSIQISSTTTAKSLAVGMDITDWEPVLANVKTDSADDQSQSSSEEKYTNDMSDNVNIVNSRENDHAALCSIVTTQKSSDTITDAREKSKKRGRKRKIDSLTMEAVEQHVGKPISQAAESFGVSRSTLKRFCRENGMLSWPKPIQSKKTSHATESKMSQEVVSQLSSQRSSSRWFARRHLVLFAVRIKRLSSLGRHDYLPSKSDGIYQTAHPTVKAIFKGDIIKFQFPITSGLLELENEVAQRLNLQAKRLSIKYKDEENDLLLITCDADLHSFRDFLARNPTAKLLVDLASY